MEVKGLTEPILTGKFWGVQLYMQGISIDRYFVKVNFVQSNYCKYMPTDVEFPSGSCLNTMAFFCLKTKESKITVVRIRPSAFPFSNKSVKTLDHIVVIGLYLMPCIWCHTVQSEGLRSSESSKAANVF